MTLAFWREIALLLLIAEGTILVLVLLVLTFMLRSVVHSTTREIEEALHRAQEVTTSVAQQADSVSRNRIVTPVVRLYAARAWARTLVSALLRRRLR